MNNTLRAVFIVFSFFIFANYASAQTADEIIEKHATAMGGADKWMTINTLRFTGKVSGGGNDLPITMMMKRDGKARTEITYQGMNLIRACDEGTGWTVSPFGSNKEAERLPSEEFKEIRKKSELEGELINYKSKGYKVEYLGMDDFEGSEVYKLKLTDKDGDKTYYYIDATSNLLLMKNSKRKVKEKEKKSRTVYGNYQNINGLMFPMSIENIDGDQTSGQVISIEKVEENVSLDDSNFKMP